MPGPPAPFVPTPLPNIGKSGNSPKDYSQGVTIEGTPSPSGRDLQIDGRCRQPGYRGGLISSNVEGPTSFVGPGSLRREDRGQERAAAGRPDAEQGGPGGTPPNAATMMGIIQRTGWCIRSTRFVQSAAGDHGKLKETAQSKADAGGLAAKFEAELVKVNGKISTMLGVVRCLCGKNYADRVGRYDDRVVRGGCGARDEASRSGYQTRS